MQASVMSMLSIVALLVLQQCHPTSSAAVRAADAAINRHATVTALPPAELSGKMLRPLRQPHSQAVVETHHRHRLLRQQPTNVSGGSINTAALDTQQKCLDSFTSATSAQCKKTRDCLQFCARSPPDLNDSTCVCCRPGYIPFPKFRNPPNRQCVGCSKGSFAKFGAKSCSQCPKGTFTDANNQAACVNCPQGFTTTGEGSTSCNECVLGRQTNSCKPCPIGTYGGGGLKAKASCQPCPQGMTTRIAGATVVGQCFKPPCNAFPCTVSPMMKSTCTNIRNGPNSPAGRTCTCPVGGFYSEQAGCQYDSCQNFPCTQSPSIRSTCANIRNGPNSPAGRTCTCPIGGFYSEQAGCQYDACQNFPCTQNPSIRSTCANIRDGPNSPAGRTCTCPTGTVYSDQAGCQGDSCQQFPCTQGLMLGSTTCANIPNVPISPAGRTCTCPTGGVYSEANGCQDVCQLHPCVSDAINPVTCEVVPDGPNSPAGRTCICANALEYTEEAGCQDANACILWPCANRMPVQATCKDLFAFPNSPFGRTCECPGTTFVYSDDLGCIDTTIEFDACEFFPCNDSGGDTLCDDIESGEFGTDGRICSCSNANQHSEEFGCAEENACLSSPCTAVAGPVTCKDEPGPDESRDGRSCLCAENKLYDEEIGCIEFDACDEFPCSHEPPTSQVQSTCTDIPGGEQALDGRRCTCPPGLFYEEFVGCTTDDPATWDACKTSPCAAFANPICTDKVGRDPTAFGRTCNCTDPTQVYVEGIGCLPYNQCFFFPCMNSGPAGEAVCFGDPNGPRSQEGRTCSCSTIDAQYTSQVGCACPAEKQFSSATNSCV
jgi:hypothetical protein